jgi:ABC-type nitrate/sulfonate/bicarbonate transport system substrate-binding protein
MRRILAAALLLLAGCGGAAETTGSGGELRLGLDGPPTGVHAGIYLAVERGYDRSAGVTLVLDREPLDLRLVPRSGLDRDKNVAVMAILQRSLFLTTDRVTLDEREDDVRAAAEAIQRGYEEAIVDPEGAVAAMVAAGAGTRESLAASLDAAAPKFKAGAAEFGEVRGVPPGLFEPDIVRPSDRGP